MHGVAPSALSTLNVLRGGCKIAGGGQDKRGSSTLSRGLVQRTWTPTMPWSNGHCLTMSMMMTMLAVYISDVWVISMQSPEVVSWFRGGRKALVPLTPGSVAEGGLVMELSTLAGMC